MPSAAPKTHPRTWKLLFGCLKLLRTRVRRKPILKFRTNCPHALFEPIAELVPLSYVGRNDMDFHQPRITLQSGSEKIPRGRISRVEAEPDGDKLFGINKGGARLFPYS